MNFFSHLEKNFKYIEVTLTLGATVYLIFKHYDKLSYFFRDYYENKINNNLIKSHDLLISWDDIIGQDELLYELKRQVLIPFKFYEKFDKNSVDLPKAILLHGPPGCGKTMIAQALAKDVNANFLNIRLDTIQEKYYGESSKLVKALFTLANKLCPSIIFIDEIDCLLSVRSQVDHEATQGIKSQFLQFWDGLNSDESKKILIIGTTNRKLSIDEAFISRFDFDYCVPLPNVKQRKSYFQKLLGDHVDPFFNYDEIVEKTENYSYRDIKNLCKKVKNFRTLDDEYINSNEKIILRKITNYDLNKFILK